ALKAELFAEKVGEDRGGERGGQVGRRERGHGDVGRHDRVRSGLDGGLEGDELQALEPLAVGRDGGEIDMAVDGGVAVAREVFRGGERQVLLIGVRALDERLDVRGYGRRVFAEGADVDDWVVGVVVDVRDRIIDPVDADGARFARGDLALKSGQRRVAGR